jgi:cellulose synthase/poly-beta-1,6-N-acetylglucosamine synthase-like glycosyltransferase
MNIIISALLWTVAIISVYFAIFWLLVFLDGGAVAHKKKKLTKFPFVTIVIPAYNECFRDDTGEVRGVVDTTIRHAMGLNYPKNRFEVIVVNDGSTDNTHNIISATVKTFKGRNIKYINNKVNRGKHSAMNDALKIAKGEFLVSLDGDSLLEPDNLRKMLPYFSSEDIACVCPNMLVHDPQTVIEKVQWFEYIVNMFYKKLMSHIDCVHVAPGPFSVYRTHVIKKIGGFKEAHKTEDLEITYRMQKNHYRIVQALDVKVHTKAPNKIKVFLRQRKRWFLGATLNTIDYRGMIFKEKYGNFGTIQLPLVVISPMLALTVITTFGYYSAKYYYKFIRSLYVINFDVTHYMRLMTINFNILDLDFVTMSTGFFMFAITFWILWKAFKVCDEKITKHGIVPLYVFLFMYYLIISSVWLFVVRDIAWRKKLKW